MAKLKKDGTPSRQGEGEVRLDGLYPLDEIQSLTAVSSFNKEKELVDFVESNIIPTTEILLGEKYLGHKREWRFGFPTNNFSTGYYFQTPRIDLVVETRDGRRIGIECKNPTQVFSENSKVVSQLLSYIVLAKKAGMPFDRAILLTTKVSDNIIEVIREFRLPIEILVISREFGALWRNG